MIIVWGCLEAKSENIEHVLALSLEHVRRSRLEPGCISHSAMIDAEHHNRVLFFEEWEDMAALQAHFTVPASKEFVESVSQLVCKEPEIRIFDSQIVG